MNLLVKLSIIVPVYNAEMQLKKCIESLINQDYSNIEIILINDGSKDNSLDICINYSKLDSRIKVINQKNMGVSKARENGIKKSTGDFLTFVDSDDYIDKNMYVDMLDVINSYDADIVECGYNIVNEKYELLNEVKLKKNLFVGRDDCLRSFLKLKDSKSFLWNKIYKINLFEDFEFESFSYSEDYLWNVKLFSKCSKKVTISKCYYNYLNNINGACNNIYNVKQIDSIYAALSAKKYLEINKYNYSNYCVKYLMQYSLVLFKQFYKKKNEYNDILLIIIKLYNENYNLKVVKNISSFKNLFSFIIFRISPKLYLFLLNIVGK